MSEARFNEAKVGPWDTAVVVMALVSIGAAILGMVGLISLSHRTQNPLTAQQQCATCKAFVEIKHAALLEGVEARR